MKTFVLIRSNMRSILIRSHLRSFAFLFALLAIFFPAFGQSSQSVPLRLNDRDYFEARGLNVMVFSNWYNGLFSDSKMSGVEIIHHEMRTVTNGDVRLNATPEQWDPIPTFKERKLHKETNSIEAFLHYPNYNFNYTIKATAANGGIVLSVHLDKALPRELEGIAGFNLEFLPSAYFKKGFLADGKSGVFPLYPTGPMQHTKTGATEPLPIARGKSFVFAPEDPARHISIRAGEGELLLYDGRNKAQNGWFVLRTLIPSGRSGKVIEWFLKANTIDNWTRPPVIAHSQVGYHPAQKKVAYIELDKYAVAGTTAARLLQVTQDGHLTEKLKAISQKWGTYTRYIYYTFDFSAVKEPGLYVLEYGKQRTKPFRIAADVYDNAWQPTLDVFFPVQMDHMFVNEAYRVWHGASHLDDALQAPVNHEHFDLYKQGPETDTRFQPGEHIPGLDIGGWYDAGDFDIRTQTVYGTVLNLVLAWEQFGVRRDETTVNQQTRYVDIHVPDGQPDLLQQIEHGTLFLISHYRSVGHALNGIVEAHLHQYHHLGDAVTKTDNLIYNARLDSLQTDGRQSGVFDDRWAFTNKSTPLDYGSIAALAAASRALRGYNNILAGECLATAKKVWQEEHSRTPEIFRHGNTTGGPLEDEELKAATELLICTGDAQYAKRINELMPYIERTFGRTAAIAVRVLPFMDDGYKKKIETLARKRKEQADQFYTQNPFGVPISTGGWAGSGQVIGFAITNYLLHKAFPEIFHPEDVYRGLHYIYGSHPGSDISFVSAVGTESKMVAYGSNRADYSFIAGGIVPGVLILPPDFPENKEDWPFLWGENEYVVNLGATYIFLVHAAKELLNKEAGMAQAGK